MILATPLNHHIVTLCTLLEPVAGDPRWRQDALTWLAVGATFLAARSSEARTRYPVTVRRMDRILGPELVDEILANPAHPHYMIDHNRAVVVEKVFGALVSEAHEIALMSESEWHESALTSERIKDTMGSMYYAVRFMAGGQFLTFEKGMEAASFYKN
ncbi:hypothetical protein D3C76_1346360 [compost metagenome]